VQGDLGQCRSDSLDVEAPDAVLGEELLDLLRLEPSSSGRRRSELEQAHSHGSSADGDKRSSAG
jgi:hypothetical protein